MNDKNSENLFSEHKKTKSRKARNALKTQYHPLFFRGETTPDESRGEKGAWLHKNENFGQKNHKCELTTGVIWSIMNHVDMSFRRQNQLFA